MCLKSFPSTHLNRVTCRTCGRGGIGAVRWRATTSPAEVIGSPERFGTSCSLSETVICLPVHQVSKHAMLAAC